MDLIVHAADEQLLTPYVYPESWPEDYWGRQILTLFVVTNLGGYALYLFFATLSYVFIFDKSLMRHKKFLENQIALEIAYTCRSIPMMSLPTIALFLAELRGYSRLYDNVDEYGVPYLVFSFFFFLFFTDMCIYWIHRWLHHPLIYGAVHKPHHKWLVPSPFASHAFHWLDGFLQSSPYHIFVFLFPLHKLTYLGLFVFVNFWTISIHDGDYRVPKLVEDMINGAAHHTDHHLFFRYNYGQFFTLWDRLCGSYRHPSSLEGHGPIHDVREADAKAKSHDGATNGHVNGTDGHVGENGTPSTPRRSARMAAKGTTAADVPAGIDSPKRELRSRGKMASAS